jgi:hypothetical protein
MKRIQSGVLVAALCVLGVSGCREEGPAERAGRAIDDAAREAGESLRDLAGEDGALERAGREADEALAKVKKAIEKD